MNRFQLALKALRYPNVIETAMKYNPAFGLLGNGYGGYGAFQGTSGADAVLSEDKFGAALSTQVLIPLANGVNHRKTIIGSAKWEIKRRSDDEPVADSELGDDKHPLATAIHDFQIRSSLKLFEMWELSRVVAGESYVHLIKNKGKKVTGLEWLNPLAIEPQIVNGQISCFRYSPVNTGHYAIVAPQDMVFDRNSNLLNEFEGISPVETALMTANIALSAKRTLLAEFRNNSRMGMAISPVKTTNSANFSISGEMFSKEDIRAIQDALINQTKGAHNSNRAVILPIPATIDMYEMRNLDPVLAALDGIDKDMYAALNVPPALVGDPDQRYQVSPIILQAYLMMVTMELKTIAGYVNLNILPAFDSSNDYYFGFDMKPFEYISDEQLKIREQARQDYQAGGLTFNEYRIKISVDILEGGDVTVDGKFGKDAKEPEPVPAQLQAVSDDPITPDVEATQAEKPNDNLNQDKSARKAMDVDKSIFVSLPLGARDELVSLQRKLKEQLTIGGIEWQEPDTFHVTLCYVESIEDTELDQSIIESGKQLSIRIAHIGQFNNQDGRPLVLFVDHDENLDQLQASIYQQFENNDTVSPYSIPRSWQPHITMAYIPNGQDIPAIDIEPFTLGVDEVAYQKGEYEDYARVSLKSAHNHTHDKLSWQDFQAKYYTPLPQSDDDKQITELKSLANFIRKGTHQKRSFEFKSIQLPLQVSIAQCLENNAIKSALTLIDATIETLSFKAIQAVRVDYELAIEDLIIGARDGSVPKDRFVRNFDRLNKRYGTLAYRDGLADGGVEVDELDDDSLDEIDALASGYRDYVRSFADTLYGDGISDAEAENKPTLWSNKTLLAFYDAGKLSADKNGLYEWARGNTSDSCSDCIRLESQVHRLKDWHKKGWLPNSQSLECKGFACKCTLNRTSGKARGNW